MYCMHCMDCTHCLEMIVQGFRVILERLCHDAVEWAWYGFYEFDYVDDDGWPHYKVLAQLPHLKAGEQSVLMKEAIVNYFVETEYIK